MPIEITMPRLSDTMEVGTILKWHVQDGESVSAGDLLADIETDKATMELQSFDDGTIGELIVKEGEQVNVGTTIATILEEDDSSTESTGTHRGNTGNKSNTSKESNSSGYSSLDDAFADLME